MVSFKCKVIIERCRNSPVNLMDPFPELCSPQDPPGMWPVSPGSGSAARGLKVLHHVTLAGVSGGSQAA